jgi:hypothetical protein
MLRKLLVGLAVGVLPGCGSSTEPQSAPRHFMQAFEYGAITQKADSQISLYNGDLTLNQDHTYLLWNLHHVGEGADYILHAYRDTIQGTYAINGTQIVLRHPLDGLGRMADTGVYTEGAQTIAAMTRHWNFWGVSPSFQVREIWYVEYFGAPNP